MPINGRFAFDDSAIMYVRRIHFRYALGSVPQCSQGEIASHVEECLGHKRGERLLYKAVDCIENIIHVRQIKALVKLLSQHLYLMSFVFRI